MVNSKLIGNRLKKIMDYYGLSASAFADKVGVQRSSISHILSGRNKPSLDFILKVLHAYPEVNLYWLINGKGSFPSDSTDAEKPDLPISETEIKGATTAESEIEKIVIFFKNGSFKSYSN